MYECGYMVHFWKTPTPEARALSEQSRGEYLGLGPDYQLGSLADPNWSYYVDARRRSGPPAASSRTSSR